MPDDTRYISFRKHINEEEICKRHINCKFLLLEIQAKQLWHWYWNIAGINTIYLSIFTLIYSSSIQYNEIIEGLSLGRNIRFNPGLLMVSKRRGGKASGKKKTKMAENLKSWKTKEEFNVLFIYSYPRCTLLLKSLDKRTRWQIVHHTDLSVTIIHVSIHFIYKNFLPTSQSKRRHDYIHDTKCF